MIENREIVQSWHFYGDGLRVSVTGGSLPISVVAPVVASPQQVLLSERKENKNKNKNRDFVLSAAFSLQLII